MAPNGTLLSRTLDCSSDRSPCRLTTPPEHLYAAPHGRAPLPRRAGLLELVHPPLRDVPLFLRRVWRPPGGRDVHLVRLQPRHPRAVALPPPAVRRVDAGRRGGPVLACRCGARRGEARARTAGAEAAGRSSWVTRGGESASGAEAQPEVRSRPRHLLSRHTTWASHIPTTVAAHRSSPRAQTVWVGRVRGRVEVVAVAPGSSGAGLPPASPRAAPTASRATHTAFAFARIVDGGCFAARAWRPPRTSRGLPSRRPAPASDSVSPERSPSPTAPPGQADCEAANGAPDDRGHDAD